MLVINRNRMRDTVDRLQTLTRHWTRTRQAQTCGRIWHPHRAVSKIERSRILSRKIDCHQINTLDINSVRAVIYLQKTCAPKKNSVSLKCLRTIHARTFITSRMRNASYSGPHIISKLTLPTIPEILCRSPQHPSTAPKCVEYLLWRRLRFRDGAHEDGAQPGGEMRFTTHSSWGGGGCSICGWGIS